MAFSRPTLNEIISRVESDLLSRVETGVGILRRSFLRVLARVFGSAVNLHFSYMDWLSKQLFPVTATADYLERHGEPWNIIKKQPTIASGNIDFTGTNGTNIPTGTKVQNEDGNEYETTAPGIISGGAANINIQAMDAGADYNREYLAILVVVNPIAGIDDQAKADASGITGGSDIESPEPFRTRILERIRTPAMGGADADYISWAKDTAGLTLTRAWVKPEFMGPMTVYIFFVLDEQDPIFPDAGEIASVQNQIETYSPNTARVTVAAPVDRKIAIVTTVYPDTAAVRESVKNNILNLFINNNVAETLYKAALDEAISLATGELSHEITALSIDSQWVTPPDDIYIGNSDLCTLEYLIVNGITVYTIY